MLISDNPAQQTPSTNSTNPISLFIGGIDIFCTDSHLQESLSSICPILNVSLRRFYGNEQNRGFGFITVSSYEDAAKLTSQEVYVDGRRVDIHLARNKEQLKHQRMNNLRRRLFVGGLCFDTSDEDFRQYFGIFGKLDKCYIIREPKSKKSKGFGFLEYKEEATADYVLGLKYHV